MHGAERDTRCHRCGGLLGMGHAVLYQTGPGLHADEIAGDPARAIGLLRQQLGRQRRHGGNILVRLLRRLREIASGPRRGWYGYAPLGPDYEMFCQRCGERSIGGEATTYHAGGANVFERLLFCLRWSPPWRWRRPRRAFLRRRPPYEDAEGRIDISRLLTEAAFTVYGLKGSPLRLRLRGVGWGVRRGRRGVDHVSFTYVAEGPNPRRRAVELRQGGSVAGRSAEGRLFMELQQVVSLVMGHGSEELRREYLRRGNVHRDWNLERMSRAERRRLTIAIDETPVEVELAHWWAPEPVTLAHSAPDGHSVLATAVGITPIELLALLKTMTALRGNAGVVAEHQEGLDEARRSLTGQD